MTRRLERGLSLARLRWSIGLLFLGLAIPAAILVGQAFVQLELGEFRRQQLIAEQVVRRIDTELGAALRIENARPVTDFEFSRPASADGAVRLSPLSSVSAPGVFPGTIGYFQVDAEGQLSTPLLPEAVEESATLDDVDVESKVEVERRVAEVLEANRLLNDAETETVLVTGSRIDRPADSDASAVPGDEVTEGDRFEAGRAGRGQQAFDELARAAEAGPRAAAPEAVETGDAAPPAATEAAEPILEVPVSPFSRQIEPLRFSVLETGHFVLFRNAFRDGQRYVQGMLVEPGGLIDESVLPALAAAGLAAGTSVSIAAAARPVAGLARPAGPAPYPPMTDWVEVPERLAENGSILYQARLSPPLAEIELAFGIGNLERGPAATVLVFTAVALAGILIGGFVAMYRFGVQQVRLARQQRNFVSAVSHELKTPLTSIRMYGEMLKSGWADESRKNEYYAFILAEGERLSRLIDNVLHLARLDRGGPEVSIEPVALAELFDLMRSKLATQCEQAGLALDFEIDPAVADASIDVDVDALTQVLINLVDNAIKFAGDAEVRRIVIGARARGAERIAIIVRDFGPGIRAADMKRLFELFYRPNDELTRTTGGTGIGLALVRQLVTAMGGRVDVRNRDPGAEFRIVVRRTPRNH